MKKLSLILALILFATPAFAQDSAPLGESVPQSRLDLAQKMHEVWPIRTRMETAINSVGEAFPEEKRAEIKAALRKNIKYDQLEEASIEAMAETYTDEELEKMIEFYGSETGRSISAKT
ncbi:MAG TPA: DUF2059 domain-containing protein, partial [Micavibrio sp.]|nr:DUF2059 domain-containing protein [Micavibrio sp.]